jgi:hypothetical protein
VVGRLRCMSTNQGAPSCGLDWSGSRVQRTNDSILMVTGVVRAHLCQSRDMRPNAPSDYIRSSRSYAECGGNGRHPTRDRSA